MKTTRGILAGLVLLAVHMPLLVVRGQSLRSGWGATPYSDAAGTGVTFRAWAPHASSFSVAGSFNGWSATANPLVLESPATGVWSVDVPAARASNNYKFVINDSIWRTDPRSRIVNSADNDNSVVYGTNSFPWSGDTLAITNARDLVIYEAHVGTFYDSAPTDGVPSTFAAMTNKLDHLAGLGISAIELMPLNEFPSATSWGYNPAYPFAIEGSYGTPDQLKQLIRACHERGIAVLLDVVHNHWDGGSSLWQFDGWTPDPAYGGIYFYNTSPYAFTPWGPRPDYGRTEVRQFIDDTFRMWIDDYHIQGFRWDAPWHIIYTTNSVFIPDGLLMVTNALSMMASNYPAVLNIAEDIKEISGFNAYWDFTFHYEVKDVLIQSSDSSRDMPTVARNINGTFGRIVYMESHDTAGDLNGGQRLPYAIYPAEAAGYYARKRSTLGAVLAMTAPGTPMILQAQEMLETNQFSDTRPVDWTRTNTWSGIVGLYRDLIRLRRNLDGVSEGLEGDGVSTYHVDNVNKVVAYSRWAVGTTSREVVVVANFANTTRVNYAVPFPAEGMWYVHFNSDSTNYCADYFNTGSVDVAAAGYPASGSLTIGPYSALILSPIPRSGMLIREHTFSDVPAGDGDGVVDPGEAIREQVVLWNKSQLTATNISSHLACAAGGVTVTVATAVYPSIAPDTAATNAVPFEFGVDPTTACGTVLDFELATTFNGATVTNVFEHTVGALTSYPAVTNAYASTNTPMPIADYATTYSALTVDEPGSNTVRDLDVLVRINHTYDRDLTLAVQHPDGTEVLLVNRRGGSGDNFGTGACGAGTNTTFDQSAALSITSGVPPFAGIYRPEGNLDLLRGKPLNGTWRLRMRDSYRNNTGTNLCWSLRATYEQQSYACNCFSNTPPVAQGTTVVLYADSTTNITLAGYDAEAQALAFSNAAPPVHGSVSAVHTSTWTVAYTPIHNFAGTDTFTFIAHDGLTNSAPGTIECVVQSAPDADVDGLPDWWEVQYFTNATLAVPTADTDGDGMSDEEEWRAFTNPQDTGSVLRLAGRHAPDDTFTLLWSSVGGTRYGIEYGSLSALLQPTSFAVIAQAAADQTDPAPHGQASSMEFVDDFTLTPPLETNGSRLYRLRVLAE